MAAIVRHADRPPIATVTESLGVGLNEKGRENARRFGEGIAGERQVRFFHSPAVRCRETAEAMSVGLAGNGNKVLSCTETWDLCAPYLLDDRTLEVADRLGHGFIRAWFNGEIDKEWILPAPDASDKVLHPILERLTDPCGTTRLDIHVSHDWELILLRDTLFGTQYEQDGWIGYLDGMVFMKDGGKLTALWGEAETEIDL
ncbi:MAG: histidine phosphatase family protein [Methanomassiliicoccus sp.]|nr:histidine phosphatase family protein [Methanomassiliicoccus sp.]